MRALVTAYQRGLWSFVGYFRKSTRLWELVDMSGIVVFVGPNGSGKSLAAVHSLLPILDGQAWECDDPDHFHNRVVRRHADGCEDCDTLSRSWCPDAAELLESTGRGERLVYSTVTLLDEYGQPHRLYRALTDFRQLVRIEHAAVLMDEVTGVSDSSTSASMPVLVKFWVRTLRKGDVQLRVTSPGFAECSKPIREVAQVLIDCRSFFPEHGASGRLWRPRKAMLFRAFDAKDFEHFTAHTRDKLKMLAGAAFWRPGCEAEKRYNTLAQVHMLGHVTEAGLCSLCGGTRTAPKCACDDIEVGGLDRDELTIVSTVTAAGTRTRRAVAAGVPPGGA